jgi:hypothetical protein
MKSEKSPMMQPSISQRLSMMKDGMTWSERSAGSGRSGSNDRLTRAKSKELTVTAKPPSAKSLLKSNKKMGKDFIAAKRDSKSLSKSVVK